MLRTRVRAGAVAGLVMSLVFAALLSFVQRSDTLVKEWAPKLGERTPVTLRVPYAPVIVKYRDDKTDLSTTLEDLLR